MKIDRIILRFVRIPLRFEFQNRWQRIREWTKLIVELQSDGAFGYGECTAMETPYYSYETIDTSSWVINKWLADLLLNCEFEHPREVIEVFSLISGHHEAKATLECAAWDLYARAHAVPLYELIGGTRRPVRSGATVGVKKDIEAALKVVGAAVAAGYERIKLKIKPGWDKELLSAVRAAFPQVIILADANGAYSGQDIDKLVSLDQFGPLIIEQPFPAAAWIESAALQSRISAPVCLDESISCMEDVELMLHMKAARMVNLKVGRVGGISESIRIHDRCADAGVPVFIGSKIETGIGRWMNIAVCTLDNVLYPSDVGASERYFVEEIVRDPITLVGPGLVQPLAGPGAGTEINPATMLKYAIKTEVISR
jgi:O-succinylbenzoate synthase